AHGPAVLRDGDVVPATLDRRHGAPGVIGRTGDAVRQPATVVERQDPASDAGAVAHDRDTGAPVEPAFDGARGADATRSGGHLAAHPVEARGPVGRRAERARITKRETARVRPGV